MLTQITISSIEYYTTVSFCSTHCTHLSHESACLPPYFIILKAAPDPTLSPQWNSSQVSRLASRSRVSLSMRAAAWSVEQGPCPDRGNRITPGRGLARGALNNNPTGESCTVHGGRCRVSNIPSLSVLAICKLFHEQR